MSSVNTATINALNNLQKDAQTEVLRRAGEKYGFDVTEAITEFVEPEVNIDDADAPKKKAAPKKKVVDKSEGKAEKPPKFVPPAFALPWTGVVVAGCCQAIRGNYNTFTQCTNLPRKGSNFCSTCSKDDAPKCGTVENRNNPDWRDPDKGLAPKHSPNYIKSKKLDPLSVLDEAAKFGITITLPDLLPPSKPSKPTHASTHDTDDDDHQHNHLSIQVHGDAFALSP